MEFNRNNNENNNSYNNENYNQNYKQNNNESYNQNEGNLNASNGYNGYGQYNQGGNGYTFNAANSNTQNMNYTTPVDVSYSAYVQQRPKKKRGGFRKAMSYILTGVICATIGAGASLGAAFYILPNTTLFEQTPLYKSVAENSAVNSVPYDLHPTTTAPEEGALTITEIVKKVGPAVVGVSVKSVAGIDWFGNERISEGIGSGMIINEEGYVLTNYHVISGAQDVKVILNNGKEVNAKVVNYNASQDIAVVKIAEDIKVPGVVELGNSSSLQVGETVVAIGNPLGKEFLGSVTSGIVSAVNRNLGDSNVPYIQTDAAINNGNSGGPLLNSRGQVIGINTAKIDTTGTNSVDGMGFAIPIDLVKEQIPDLSKPILMIGISGRDIDAATAKANNLVEGAYIQSVQEFSPAEMAGLRPGDVITKFNGQKVKTIAEINALKSKLNAGDVVKIEVYRNGKYKELELTLRES
ncbi:S1C family serine protease [Clostridium thermarum]|uniref:S1C family serine protease n=1 Tax=Clostridium thermarum TaxID=1716543 RepID=UPI0013D6261E|nr:trypsin-like peptidase domain-containing protein [Clostridium thermarum]